MQNAGSCRCLQASLHQGRRVDPPCRRSQGRLLLPHRLWPPSSAAIPCQDGRQGKPGLPVPLQSERGMLQADLTSCPARRTLQPRAVHTCVHKHCNQEIIRRQQAGCVARVHASIGSPAPATAPAMAPTGTADEELTMSGAGGGFDVSGGGSGDASEGGDGSGGVRGKAGGVGGHGSRFGMPSVEHISTLSS